MEDVTTNTFAPSQSVTSHLSPLPSFPKKSKVCVIGAGAFGGWTALYLQRHSFNVTLVEPWGPGNSRSSSGDETRVIRSTYGASELYFQMNVRALQLWQENQVMFPTPVFINQGVLWLCYQESNPLVDDSIPYSVKYNAEYERLSHAEIKHRYPLISSDDIHHAYLDPFGGYLKARESCVSVRDLFLKEGGKCVNASAVPDTSVKGTVSKLALSNGESINADVYIFACGAWLPKLFPFLGPTISCTRQEVYYLGVPETKAQQYDAMPVWIDLDGKDFYYGIPGNSGRGFKIGVDKRGASFDPTSGERKLDESVYGKARDFVAHRFPGLKDAPLIESRVCPYENSLTGNFIYDKHPDCTNVFFLGGGSGHGFKHGPALGELVAKALRGDATIPDLFRIYP